MILIPNNDLFWVVDRNQHVRDDVGTCLRSRDPNIGTTPFDTPEPALESSTRLPDATSPPPGFVVTDSIGVTPMADGESVASSLRKASPLSLVILHSLSSPPDRIAELKRSRQIDHFVSKTRFSELLEFGLACHARGQLPVLCRLAAHIRELDDPEEPFYEDGRGGFLNLFEVYREILRGTELGVSLARSWERILPATPRSASAAVE